MDHDYMHAHGIPHGHHDHEEAHSHGSSPACPAGGCADCDVDPRAEVIALMRYMVNHNAAHAGELAALAGRLKDVGDAEASEQVMRAVSDFEKGNLRLSAVLAAMEAPR